jgi:hypothetical protein
MRARLWRITPKCQRSDMRVDGYRASTPDNAEEEEPGAIAHSAHVQRLCIGIAGASARKAHQREDAE